MIGRVVVATGLLMLASGALLVLHACPVEQAGLPCPCGTGYECCVDVCVADGTCNPTPGSDAGTLRDGGAPDAGEDGGAVDAGPDAGVPGEDGGVPVPACDFDGEGDWCAVTVVRQRSCALSKWGQVYCWGLPEPAPPLNRDVRAVDLGAASLCILKADGSFACQVVLGTPLEVSAKAIAAGGLVRCVIDSADRVRCWGLAPMYLPVGDADMVFAKQISGNDQELCAVQLDDSLWCGGDFVQGWPMGTFSEVSVGEANACGLRSSGDVGQAVCWGLSPPSGAVMDSVSAYQFTDIAAGAGWGCGIVGGDIVCFGPADEEQEPHLADAPPAGAVKHRQIAVSDSHGCAITVDDDVVCWGSNDEGQLEVPEVAP